MYKLPLLEILDLSRNKISHIPEEIKRLSSLRVLSIMQNRLDDLPFGISEMNKLQILKVAGNPLRYPLRRVLETSETEIAPSTMTDNEKEVAVTAELKRFLKTRQLNEQDRGNESRYCGFSKCAWRLLATSADSFQARVFSILQSLSDASSAAGSQ